MNIQEKRTAKRWTVFKEAHFRPAESSRFLECMLLDINVRGARISSREQLKKGDIVELHADIPDSLNPLIVKAKVVYVRPMPRLIYEYGVIFPDIKRKGKEKIFDYIYKNYPKEFRKSMLMDTQKKRGGEEEMFKTDQAYEDRRIFARIPVDLYARYFDNARSREGYFRVIDISAKGMGVRTKEKFAPNSHIELWVSIPGQKSPIYMRGDIIWHKPDDISKGYRCGISLEKAYFMNFPSIVSS